MLRVLSWIAIVFGVMMVGSETIRNWGDWQWWPFWVVDFILAGLLIAGGWLTLSGSSRGPVFLSGAWGFTCAAFYMVFFGNIGDLPAGASPSARTMAIGYTLLFTAACFVLALAYGRQSTRLEDD